MSSKRQYSIVVIRTVVQETRLKIRSESADEARLRALQYGNDGLAWKTKDVISEPSVQSISWDDTPSR